MKSNDYLFIQTEKELFRYLENLKKEGITLIALDIEGEFNLHAYGEKLCLVQVFDGSQQVLIDPFPLSNEALGELFGDEKIIKIMFDASSDASLLKNRYQIDVRSILDLRIAVELLNFEKKNLHFVLNKVVGKQLTNKKKFQRYNWGRRPLDPQALEYALSDVIYLFEAKDEILKMLVNAGLYEEFLLRSIVHQNKNYKKNLADRHKKFKGYRRFTPREQNIFKEIFYIRDRYAREMNLPPHMVIENKEVYPLLKDLGHIRKIHFNRWIKPEIIGSLQDEILGISS